ncbi:MAG: transposase [Planctomycetota bacterium]
MPRYRRKIRQHELTFRTWGGARDGAGRKRSSARSRVPHVERSHHNARVPLHVTLRLNERLPSLRGHLVRSRVLRAFGDGRERFGLRLNQFSLQSNHIHLIVEADDRRALSRGMKGITVRVARTLNRLWKRKGSVFSDRFHARPLRTPREVRSALLYVLNNARHHGMRSMGVDPCSSGPWFDGWRQGIVLEGDGPGARAKTWLLREGWRRHGLIGIQEVPRSHREGERACRVRPLRSLGRRTGLPKLGTELLPRTPCGRTIASALRGP